jgi:hypothetical protein
VDLLDRPYALEQKSKLVAAQSRHGVGEARRFDEPLRHRLQQSIAGIVTQGVIDVLEVVKIKEHHGHPMSAPLRQRQGVLDAVAEQASVRKQRQRIMKRQVPQLLLERLALADVAEVKRESAHRRIVRQIAADYLEHVAIEAAVDAQFDRADGPLGRRSNFGEERPQRFAVIASPEIQQIFPGDVFGVQAERAFGGGGCEMQGAVHRNNHDDVGGVRDQRSVTALDHARCTSLAGQCVLTQD